MRIKLILLFMSIPLVAHEFVHKQKNKRVTLSSIKDEYGEIFSQQLRESAIIVQAIGRVQQLDIDQQPIQTMQDIVCKLHSYSRELPNLIGCSLSEHMLCPKFTSVKQMLPELTTIIGSIQQHVINHLQDLLEDTGAVFARQHTQMLSDLVPKIKRYTQDLHTVHSLLIDVERLAQKKETVIVKEKV